MNRRSFFRGLGLAVAAVTAGLHLFNPKIVPPLDCPGITRAGFRGDEFLKTGFIYAPYIPLYVTSEIYVNTEFMNRFNSHQRIPYAADKEAFQRQLDKIWQTVTITA